ncbi:MAG TPA: NAD(P)-dependent oxidoreductase [Burkholderiales bacterium]|nr:NAD(P)-dependent oxidoreductase [Burkholderiales bacterium]
MIVHARAAPAGPQRVVVLGAHGFIGAALIARLKQAGIPILPLASKELDLAASDAPGKLARLLEPSDSVVMLAALTPDKGRDAGTLLRNVAMMQAVCAAFEETGCAHLVYFSSDAVYGPGPSLVSEETPAAPQDFYGAMHLSRELMASGVKAPLLVLRPTLVYGAGDPHNAYGPNRFRRAAREQGKIQLFGEGEETRDHIHVHDVAEIACLCLQHGSRGTLNVATGRSLSFRGVAELVAAQSHKQPVEIAAGARTNPVTHRHYDVTALLKAFPGYRFISLEEGVARCHGAP